MNRRIWLGLCVSALSAGCLGTTAPRKKKIAWIRLQNNHDDAQTIAVTIGRGGEAVFGETYHLGTSPGQATVRVDSPVEKPGRYSLYFDIGDQSVHLHASEFAEIDITEPCVGVQYTLHRRGTSGFEYEPIERC
jgi:hypothetical protein